MINAPDALLDLTEYRHIAGFILSLLLLRKTQPSTTLGMKLNSLRDADWLAARLNKQGYADVTIEARGDQAVLKIHKSA